MRGNAIVSAVAVAAAVDLPADGECLSTHLYDRRGGA